MIRLKFVLLKLVGVASIVPALQAWDAKTSQAYTSLLTDLKYFYNASSIYIVNKNFHENIFMTTKLLNYVKHLSGKQTLTQVLLYPELTRNYNRTFTKYPRQLFIIPLESERNLAQFSEFTRNHVLSYHIWFVMFCGPKTPALQDFCRKPSTNRFHIKFNTKMIVKCYDEPELREWYSVNSASNEVLMNVLMEWSKEKGLVVKNTENRMQRRLRRRDDLDGTLLRVSAVKEHRTSLLRSQRLGKGIPLFSNMMVELAHHINFQLRFVSVENVYGIWNRSSGKWSGILGRLQLGEIDIAVAELTMTKERLDAFDFACPLIISRAKLFVRESRGADVQWSAYLKAFSRSIWISLITLIVLSALLLSYVNSKKGQISYLKNYLVENHLNVWGIYCQQGLSEFPDSPSLRIAYVSIFFSAVVLSAVYSASIISYLTNFSPTPPFNSLTTYVKDGTFKLIVVWQSAEHEMFATSQDYILEKMNRLMKREEKLPLNDYEGFNQVCHGKVAYYTNDAMKYKLGGIIPCNLHDITSGRIENLAFTLTKHSEFTEFINYNILRFQDNGIMHRMKKMYIKKLNKPRKAYDAVGFWGIAPLITILIFGTILSVLLLLIEISYYKISRFNEKKHSSRRVRPRQNLLRRRRRKQ